jgi:hypothetical protein
MKHFYLTCSFVIVAGLWIVLSSHQNEQITTANLQHSFSPLNTSGSPVGRTGAPGETTCTGCHAGTVQDGNLGANLLSLDNNSTEYDPNSTHEVTLTFAEGAAKNGFQLTVLDENNNAAGGLDVIDNTVTQLQNGANGRQYITHRLDGTNQSEWTFNWTTPEFGGNVTFYVATNRTNSNNGSSGDVIYTSQHVFTAENTASLSEVEDLEVAFEIGYLPSSNALIIDGFIVNSDFMSANVIDLQGKSHHFENLGYKSNGKMSESIALPSLANGLYTVTIFVGNKPYSKKFMVVK